MGNNIWSSLTCLHGSIRKIPNLKNLADKLWIWIGGAAVGNAIKGVSHYLSMGVFGGIKAAYYIVKLGVDIHELIVGFNISGRVDLQSIGKIIGQAISIVKSLIGGRRRKLKLKLKLRK